MKPAGTPQSAAALPATPVALASEAHLATARQTLEELLTLMGVPGTLDVQPLPDGSISVAVQPSSELPGAPVGKRSQVLEALQFLLNKIVNKPGQERHWVALGMGEHPLPRGPRPPRTPASTPVSAVGSGSPAPSPERPRVVPAMPRGPMTARSPAPPVEEAAALDALVDAALEAEARALAEKSARFGRFLALVGMRPEERDLVVRVASAVSGVTVKTEGEGRARRVVFVPVNPVPMPRRATFPDDDEEDA